jgi:hypothetical protein
MLGNHQSEGDAGEFILIFIVLYTR